MTNSDEYSLSKFNPDSIQEYKNFQIREQLRIQSMINRAMMKSAKEPPKITIIYGDRMSRTGRTIKVDNPEQYHVTGPHAPEDAIRLIKEKFGISD